MHGAKLQELFLQSNCPHPKVKGFTQSPLLVLCQTLHQGLCRTRTAKMSSGRTWCSAGLLPGNCWMSGICVFLKRRGNKLLFSVLPPKPLSLHPPSICVYVLLLNHLLETFHTNVLLPPNKGHLPEKTLNKKPVYSMRELPIT